MAVAAAEANAQCEVPRRTGRSVAVSNFVEVVGEPSESPEVAYSGSTGTRWSMFSRASHVEASSTGASRASFAEVTPERQRQLDEERRSALESRKQKQSFQMTSVEEQKEMDRVTSKAVSERRAQIDRLQTWEVAIDRFNAEATEGRSSVDSFVGITHEAGANGTTVDAAIVEEDATLPPDALTDADSAAATKAAPAAPAAIATGPAEAAPAVPASGPPMTSTNTSFIVCPADTLTTGANAAALAAASLSSTGLREPKGASALPGPAFRLPPKVQPQRQQSMTSAVGSFFMCCSR